MGTALKGMTVLLKICNLEPGTFQNAPLFSDFRSSRCCVRKDLGERVSSGSFCARNKNESIPRMAIKSGIVA